MKQTRLKRLVRLLGVLQAGKPLDAKALASACEIGRRQVFRDLDLLRAADVPVYYDDERKCYGIPSNYFLPPTHFTAEEALAVSLLCHELGREDGVPFHAAAQSAATKLECALPAPLRKLMRDGLSSVRIQPTKANRLAGHHSTFATLRQAIAQGQAVKLRYDSYSDNEELLLDLEPYQLIFGQRSWYVIGKSLLHRALRTFNIGRIRSVELAGYKFATPKRFNLEKFLRNAWQIMPEPGPDYEVVIRFEPMVARNVAEVAWHKTQQTEFHANGSLTFRVTVSGLTEISWWILGYGDQAEVLAPPKLRDLIAQRAEQMAAKYRRKPATQGKLSPRKPG